MPVIARSASDEAISAEHKDCFDPLAMTPQLNFAPLPSLGYVDASNAALRKASAARELRSQKLLSPIHRWWTERLCKRKPLTLPSEPLSLLRRYGTGAHHAGRRQWSQRKDK